MKVRLKNHDYVNNVDAGTIFDALNERGGEFDYDFPYWHGWVKDRSGNRKFLSYSKEELELVLRPEVAAFFNKIESGGVVLERIYPDYSFAYLIPTKKYKYKNIEIEEGSGISFDDKEYLFLTSEERLYFEKMMRRINHLSVTSDEDKKLLEVLNTL